MISNNRLPVYNISKIASVPWSVLSYSWSLNSTVLSITTGGMFYVVAEDIVGCSGKPGTALMEIPVQASVSEHRNTHVGCRSIEKKKKNPSC